ncbi:hypothetical protein [Pelagibius marinus]|uniref:hypothetical protein n=1 Tax=Pelagibius marinus TaxID=2762760 RepID=UPI0018730413|nr:hypothetical protein [Pelagibius marinus]
MQINGNRGTEMNDLPKPKNKACGDRLIGKLSLTTCRRISTESRPAVLRFTPEGLRGEHRTVRGISPPEPVQL